MSHEKKKVSRVRGMESNSNKGVEGMQFKTGWALRRTCHLQRLEEVIEFED